MARHIFNLKGSTLHNEYFFSLLVCQENKKKTGCVFSHGEDLSQLNCSVTCMAAFVHHENIRPNADHSTDVTLEFSIWHSGGSSWHGFRIVGLPVASNSLRSLLWTSLLYPLPSFIFSTATWVFITVQLHFNGVGYRGTRANINKALNKIICQAACCQTSEKETTEWTSLHVTLMWWE